MSGKPECLLAISEDKKSKLFRLTSFNILMLIIFFLELIVQLHVEWNWNNDLKDQKSAAFKELSDVFEKEVGTTFNMY